MRQHNRTKFQLNHRLFRLFVSERVKKTYNNEYELSSVCHSNFLTCSKLSHRCCGLDDDNVERELFHRKTSSTSRIPHLPSRNFPMKIILNLPHHHHQYHIKIPYHEYANKNLSFGNSNSPSLTVSPSSRFSL